MYRSIMGELRSKGLEWKKEREREREREGGRGDRDRDRERRGEGNCKGEGNQMGLTHIHRLSHALHHFLVTYLVNK